MRNIIRIPISIMIKLLKEISRGGRVSRYKNIKCNTSKLSSLFNHELTSFTNHFIFINNLLSKNSPSSSVNYKILFKKYLTSIFSLFFKIKIKNRQNNIKIIRYLVKYLPTFSLYIKTKKIIDEFHEKEENEFNVDEIKKKMFILNSFLDTDEESELSDSTRNEEYKD